MDLRASVLAMRERQTHRGPDDAGFYLSPDGRVALSNNRLAIRDLSAAGHMPMSNADDTVWITYNGEIYNTDELRTQLERLGYVFHSTSDTEVVLHGYEAWGEDVASRLRGMFAFAAVRVDAASGRTRHLLLARDHLGVKPLYYSYQNGRLAFASELKALRAARLIGDEVDPAGLAGYLMLGAVPTPLTIYREAKALPPATTLTWEAGRINLKTYWQLPTNTDEACLIPEAIEQVRLLLREAVRIRLVSDVPLGAFLSGGLDSSVVVALMRVATSGPIRTCAMTFEEEAYNEAPYARAMAQAAEAEHYERVITAAEVQREFEAVLGALDQPSVDGVNTYFVSQTARQAGLTVALSGLGGDELFGGYPNTFHGVPQLLTVLDWAQRLPGGVTAARLSVSHLLQPPQRVRVSEALQRPACAASAYLARRGLFAPHEARTMLQDDLAHVASFDPVAHIARLALPGNGCTAQNGKVSYNWISRAELSVYMQPQLLRDMDAMSMAHSLEVRVPLLDRKLVETMLRLPEHLKQVGREPKPLLRRTVGDLLPAMVLQRQDKHGFIFPFQHWLRGALRQEVLAALAQVKARGWLKAKAIDEAWREYEAGRAHWSRVWALAALNSI